MRTFRRSRNRRSRTMRARGPLPSLYFREFLKIPEKNNVNFSRKVPKTERPKSDARSGVHLPPKDRFARPRLRRVRRPPGRDEIADPLPDDRRSSFVVQGLVGPPEVFPQLRDVRERRGGVRRVPPESLLRERHVVPPLTRGIAAPPADEAVDDPGAADQSPRGVLHLYGVLSSGGDNGETRSCGDA